MTVVYFAPDRDFSEKRVRLAARESTTDYFRVFSDRAGGQQQIFRVEAFDERGTLIFCRTYQRPELERVGWQIPIHLGDIACGSSAPSASPFPSQPPR